MSRCRLWSFTLFEPTELDRQHLKSVVDRGDLVYVCGQCELCPDSGRMHLQAFLCLSQPRTLVGVKRCMFVGDHLKTVHLCACRGSKHDNVKYCSKVESRAGSGGFAFFEYGDLDKCPEQNGQGQRSDLHALGRAVQEGRSLEDIAQDHPDLYIKFHRGIESLQARCCSRPRVWDPNAPYSPPDVRWFYGSSGSGKSREAFTQALSDPSLSYFTKSSGNKWWDGYLNQDIVILDDYRADWWTFSYFIRLLDCYPLSVEVKGGMVPMYASTFYITCPLRPEQLYASLAAKDDGRILQLTRRITEIRLFGDEPEAPVAVVEGFRFR